MIRSALEAGWLKVREPTPVTPDLPDLDEGEAACIRLALAFKGPVLVLMDDRAGRVIAAEQGVRIAGTAAVIGLAKSQGLIPSARDVFARLHASDFRISAKVIDTILQQLGELAS
jgi:predicted nucleic acid-binding protein